MMSLRHEMKEYYEARANEYDDWYERRGPYDKGTLLNQRWNSDLSELREIVKSISGHSMVELACGTGMWTQYLLKSNDIVPVDASPSMLRACHQRTGIRGICSDIFDLKAIPGHSFNACFFSFWLSHIEPHLIDDFWSVVRRLVEPGSRIICIDSYLNQTELNCLSHVDDVQVRSLSDGSHHNVYKKYYTKSELSTIFGQVCDQFSIQYTKNYFYVVDARLHTDQ